MSEYVSGHELDAPNSRALFNIVWGLSAVTLLAIATCVQLFNQQRDALVEEQGSSYRLQDYRQEMAQKTQKAGETEIKTADGKTLEVLKYIPLTQAKIQLLRNPQMALKADVPPQGWSHPDDINSGTQSAAGLQTTVGKEATDSVLISPPLKSQQEQQGQEVHPEQSPEIINMDEDERSPTQAPTKPETANTKTSQPQAGPKKPAKTPSKKKPVEEAVEEAKIDDSTSAEAEKTVEPGEESIKELTDEKPVTAEPSKEPVKNEPVGENPAEKETSGP